MKKKADAGDKVRFFNVSLVNASVMSVPRFPQPQRLIGELIHSVEAASPRFAWVQFLFQRVNYSPTLVALKNAMYYAAEQIKTPKTSLIDDSEYDRAELHRDWYKRSGERIKRIDAIVNRPHVLLAIQGMWVGNPGFLSSLPFKDCHDEFDRLGLFVYRNPWMLAELVERRMVEDVSSYIMSYASSRLEPPSFLVTQEEPTLLRSSASGQDGQLPEVDKQDALLRRDWDGAGRRVRARGRARRLHSAFAGEGADHHRAAEGDGDREAVDAAVVSGEGFRDYSSRDGRTEMLLSSSSAQGVRRIPERADVCVRGTPGRRSSPKPEFLKQVPEIVGLTSFRPSVPLKPVSPPSSIERRFAIDADPGKQRHALPHARRRGDGERKDQRHPPHARPPLQQEGGRERAAGPLPLRPRRRRLHRPAPLHPRIRVEPGRHPRPPVRQLRVQPPLPPGEPRPRPTGRRSSRPRWRSSPPSSRTSSTPTPRTRPA